MSLARNKRSTTLLGADVCRDLVGKTVLRCDILRLAGTDTPRLKPAEDRLSQSVAAPPRAPPFVRANEHRQASAADARS